MPSSVFPELRFWLLIAFSLVLPCAIYLAAKTASIVDDAVFLSEVGVALYVLPVLFGGIGVNLVSHVLVRHLTQAERRFDAEHRND